MQTLPTTDAEADAGKRRARRDDRYHQRDFLHHHSTLKRLRGCGRNRIDRTTGVPVAVAEGVAHYRNVQRCGSIHACPVCAPKIRSARALEIEQALRLHLEQGGGAYFVTFTLRHRTGMALALLWTVLAASFRGLLAGRAHKDDRDAYGIVGTIRSVEVTHGANGWHPHLHVLVLTDAPLPRQRQVLLRREWSTRWRRLVQAEGIDAPDDAHGVVMVEVEAGSAAMASYMSKVYDEHVMGLEAARADLKRGREGNRSVWAILGDSVATGDADDLHLWRQYERASKGRQAITWSNGLKARFAVGEITDEEHAEAEVGGEVIFTIDHLRWVTIRRRRGALAAVLRAAETAGADGVAVFLASLPPGA
jgi:hypothetical protein